MLSVSMSVGMPVAMATLSPSFAIRAMEVLLVAGGALRGATRATRGLPGMLAIRAHKSSHVRHFKITSFNAQCLAGDDGFRHFPAG